MEFRERLLESGPVWTYKNVRWKDNGHVKVLGRWRRWQFRPSYYYRVLLENAEAHVWLSYANRNDDWKVTANGYDLDQWFKENGRGLMRYTFYPKIEHYQRAPTTVEIGFTDGNVAMMLKLAMGGR